MVVLDDLLPRPNFFKCWHGDIQTMASLEVLVNDFQHLAQSVYN